MPVVIDKPINPKVLITAYSHEFGNGLKLMEHSWLGNEFVQAFESLLVLDGPTRVVWAGDYADPEVDENGVTIQLSNDDGSLFDANLYNLADRATHYRPDIKTWNRNRRYDWFTKSGRRRAKPITWWGKFDDKLVATHPAPEVLPTTSSHPWLLNYDKELAVDKRKVPKSGWGKIHPLPLLTVEGNGRGGGDFHLPEPSESADSWANQCARGNRGDFSLIGSWARDRISLSRTKPKGFTTLAFDLTES